MLSPALTQRDSHVKLIWDLPTHPNGVSSRRAIEAAQRMQQTLQAGAFCVHGATTFTFVREPLGHFLAGFGEFWVRTQHPGVTATQELAVAVLQQLFSADTSLSRSMAFRHVFPMVGVTAAFNLTFVGYLEQADADWALLKKMTGVPIGPWNKSLGTHTWSGDIRRSMALALIQNHSLRSQLCTLLAPDYARFGYQLKGCFDGTERALAIYGEGARS